MNKQKTEDTTICKYCKGLMLYTDISNYSNKQTFLCTSCTHAQAPHDTNSKLIKTYTHKELKERGIKP